MQISAAGSLTARVASKASNVREDRMCAAHWVASRSWVGCMLYALGQELQALMRGFSSFGHL